MGPVVSYQFQSSSSASATGKAGVVAVGVCLMVAGVVLTGERPLGKIGLLSEPPITASSSSSSKKENVDAFWVEDGSVIMDIGRGFFC